MLTLRCLIIVRVKFILTYLLIIFTPARLLLERFPHIPIHKLILQLLQLSLQLATITYYLLLILMLILMERSLYPYATLHIDTRSLLLFNPIIYMLFRVLILPSHLLYLTLFTHNLSIRNARLHICIRIRS